MSGNLPGGCGPGGTRIRKPPGTERRLTPAGVRPELAEVQEQVVSRSPAPEHEVRVAHDRSPLLAATEIIGREAGDIVADRPAASGRRLALGIERVELRGRAVVGNRCSGTALTGC